MRYDMSAEQSWSLFDKSSEPKVLAVLTAHFLGILNYMILN